MRQFRNNKTANLLVLALSVLLAKSLWFSASAVVPQLSAQWHLDSDQRAWLTMSVQLGFVAGALFSAILNLADRFDLKRIVVITLRDRPTRLANFGYLGHMWELYAMWAWVPLFLIASYDHAGWQASGARLAGFVCVAAGGVGAVMAGKYADRLGRTLITSLSLAVSGSCCILAGFLFDYPLLLTGLCLLWGFAVVADSAQFSAAVSELADPRYVGTALTLQTSLGFLLTVITILLIPMLYELVGWRYVFLVLVPGPVFGIWAMLSLRRLPEAAKLASGNR